MTRRKKIHNGKDDKDHLFKGSKVTEYDLFSKAVPHHDRFQRAIVSAVADKIDILKVHYSQGIAQCRNGTPPTFLIVPRENVEDMLYDYDRRINLLLEVAELGVGTGKTLGFLAEKKAHFESIHRLYAVDSSAEMVATTASRFSCRNVIPVHESFESFLAKKNDSLDICYSAYTIHNLRRELQVEAFRAISAAIKVGGYFIDGDLFAEYDSARQKRLFKWQIGMFKKHLPKQLRDEWIAHYTADSNCYLTLEETIRLLQAFGFSSEIIFRQKLEGIIVAKKIREV